MSSLLLGSLDFSLDNLSTLSSTQLALARLHPDHDESDSLKICQLWFYTRERAQQRIKRRSEGGGGGKDQDGDEDFSLIDLDFELKGDLNNLTEQQLAAIVVLAHPDATELHVLKAEKIWRRRREKAITQVKLEQVEAERVRLQEGAVTTKGKERERQVSDRLPTPARSTPSFVDVPPPPPPPPPSSLPVRPAPPRPRTPRPIPPLPSLDTRLADSLCSEIYPLKLSNLPISEINTREDVSSLFPPHLVPNAIILHRPLDPDDVARTAYVGWVDFEQRIEAMQEVIRVRIGRWRAMAEFVDASRPKWEWGDLAKEKREVVWREWNEKEWAKEQVVEVTEVETSRVEAETSGNGDEREPSTDNTHGEGWTPPIPTQPLPPIADEPQLELEPEAIVLDSPALLPSRPQVPSQTSRQSSPRYMPHYSPTPPIQPAPIVVRSGLPPSVVDSTPRSRPEPVQVLQKRDVPPHIAAQPISPAQPLLPRAPLPERPIPTGPRISSRGRLPPASTSQSNQGFVPQAVPSGPAHPRPIQSNLPPSLPIPTPSLLARTTALEVKGSAPDSAYPSTSATGQSTGERNEGGGRGGGGGNGGSNGPKKTQSSSLLERIGSNGTTGTASTSGGAGGSRDVSVDSVATSGASPRASPMPTNAKGGKGNSNAGQSKKKHEGSPASTRGGGNGGGQGKGRGGGNAGGGGGGRGGKSNNNNGGGGRQVESNANGRQQGSATTTNKGRKRPAQENSTNGGGISTQPIPSILDRVSHAGGGGGSLMNGDGGGGNRPTKRGRGGGGNAGGNDGAGGGGGGGGGSLLSRLG